MKIKVVINVDDCNISSDDLDGIREAIGIALSEELTYSSVRVHSIEVLE